MKIEKVERLFCQPMPIAEYEITGILELLVYQYWHIKGIDRRTPITLNAEDLSYLEGLRRGLSYRRPDKFDETVEEKYIIGLMNDITHHGKIILTNRTTTITTE